MTPRSIFTIIILAITLLIGGTLGYFIGHHRAISAEKALNNDVTIGKIQDVTHDQLINSLRTANVQLQNDYNALKAKNKADADVAQANWQKAMQTKDLALELATKNSTNAEVQVNSLKARLFLAMTPDEKATLQAQLDGAQKQLVELQARTDGLKCMSTPIPKEFLEAVNSSVPGAGQ